MPIRNCSFRNFELETKNIKFTIQNSKLKTQNRLRRQFKTQNSKLKTQNRPRRNNSTFNTQHSKMGKLIIFSAPSGSGKSTIINRLMQHPELHLAFSISCTSRAPRGTEKNGVEYFFLSPEEFRERIKRDEFLEYEEVYKDRFYGTLKQQVETQAERGDNVVFDVDVKGGCNIKQFYGSRALSIFIQPPSVEELRRRLTGRATDAPEVIEQRIERAEFELSQAPKFDRVVINDDLEKAVEETMKIVKEFIGL